SFFAGQEPARHPNAPAQSYRLNPSIHSIAPPNHYYSLPFSPQRGQVENLSQLRKSSKMTKSNKRSKRLNLVKIDTEEDVLNWIRERRQKYPSLTDRRTGNQESTDDQESTSDKSQVERQVGDKEPRQQQTFNKLPRRNSHYKGGFSHDNKDSKIGMLLEMLKFLKSRNYCQK
ncbi:hypothetical protein PSACC_00449, partial [Paramicrosporidium saccamoebae]